MTVKKSVPWQLIHLPRIEAISGHITAINNGEDVLFDVKRAFYIYDVPSGESRGAHAHFACHQLLVAVTGAFEVSLTDGQNAEVITLNRPHIGLHIPPMVWASEINFSGGATCLVLASHEYEEADYIRDFELFEKNCNV
jgi:hypothetical protein